MELINTTSLAASIQVFPHPRLANARVGRVVAKAWFLAVEGAVSIDLDAAEGLLSEDSETPVGILPADSFAYPPSRFEVIVLGSARPTSGTVERCTVSLEIGAVRRAIDVYGDRSWHLGNDGQWRATPPLPFRRMPLVWERAFGGSCELWIDSKSSIPLRHPLNFRGVGADMKAMSLEAARALGLDEGPLHISGYSDVLPNLEDPNMPVRGRSDSPLPVCWATVPRGHGLRMMEVYESIHGGSNGATPPLQRPDPAAVEPRALEMSRASSDWTLRSSPVGEHLQFLNMGAAGYWSFQIPDLEVLMDYEIGLRCGTRALSACRLLLLPDEGRFSIVYFKEFAFAAASDDARSVRIRLGSSA